jgi:hypothetical protein
MKNRINAQIQINQQQKRNYIIHNMKNVDTFGVLDLNKEVKKTTKKVLSNKKSKEKLYQIPQL